MDAVTSRPDILDLGNKPTVVALTGSLKSVDVANQHLEPIQGRGVVFMFDFTGDSRFSGNTRVYVSAQPVRGTEAEMQAIISNPPCPATDFSLRKFGSRTFLLVQNGNMGNSEFLSNGITSGVRGP